MAPIEREVLIWPGAVELFRMNYGRLRAREGRLDDNDLVDPRTKTWGNGSFCPTLRRRESVEGQNHGTVTVGITAKLEA